VYASLAQMEQCESKKKSRVMRGVSRIHDIVSRMWGRRTWQEQWWPARVAVLCHSFTKGHWSGTFDKTVTPCSHHSQILQTEHLAM